MKSAFDDDRGLTRDICDQVRVLGWPISITLSRQSRGKGGQGSSAAGHPIRSDAGYVLWTSQVTVVPLTKSSGQSSFG